MSAANKETPTHVDNVVGATERDQTLPGKCSTSQTVAPINEQAVPADALADDAVQTLVKATFGAPPKGDARPTPLPRPVSIAQALTSQWDDDRHFVAYQPVNKHGHWLRLNLHGDQPRALFDLIASGELAPIVMRLFVFDLDAPNHTATEEWWNQVERNLPEGNKRPTYYRTFGGARLIWRLPNPIIVATWEGYQQWRREYFAAAAALKRMHQLEADLSCADITRLFRLPNVKRVDGKPSVAGPLPWGAPNDWIIKTSKADWGHADRMVRKAVNEARKAPAGPAHDPAQSRVALLEAAIKHWPGPGCRNAAAYSLARTLAYHRWTDVAVEGFVNDVAEAVGAADCSHEITCGISAVESEGHCWGKLADDWGDEFRQIASRLLDTFHDAKATFLARGGAPAAPIELARPEAPDAIALSRMLLQPGELLFVTERKSWFVWDGKRWVADKMGRPHKAAAALLEQVESECWFGPQEMLSAKNHLLSMVQTAAGLASVSAEQFDTRSNLMNLADCTLDLDTLQAKDHDRRNMLTKLSPVSLVDVTPEASKVWGDFVASVFIDEGGKHDKELAAFVQRAVGCSLLGGREKAFYWASGEGDSGKSTFLAMLTRLLGEYACEPQASVFTRKRNVDGASGHNADLIPMVGCRVAIVDELHDAPFNTQLINLITGGGAMSISNKGEKPFPWKPQIALWLGGETEPSYDTKIGGFRNRMRRIPFRAKFERDSAFRDRLLQPDVVLAAFWWAIEGLALYQANGLGTCDAVQASTDTYVESQDDPIASFIGDVCTVGGKGWTSTSTLHTSYVAWRRQHGYQAQPENPRSFGKRLGKVPGLVATPGAHNERGWNVKVDVTGGMFSAALAGL